VKTQKCSLSSALARAIRINILSSTVFFGVAHATSLSELNGSNGFRMDGLAAFDHSGVSVAAAGDVNGDGIEDIVVGASGANLSGSTYVVFGRVLGFPALLNINDLNGATGFRIIGQSPGDRSGIAVSSAGDVNGDGIDDILVGANAADPNENSAGSSYIVFGRKSGFPAVLNLSSLNGVTGFRMDGEGEGDQSGSSVSAAGDLNGDGIGDLLIGAGKFGAGNVGRSYVVFGRRSGFAAAINLSSLNGPTGFHLDGAAVDDFSGAAVAAAGDVNGDGIDDILIGSPGTDNAADGSGSSYVVFGRTIGFPAAFDLNSVNGTNGFRLNGETAFDASGSDVSAAGDVNGDGLGDFLIGALSADSNGQDSGSTYVVFGRSSSFPAVLNLRDLDGTAGFRLVGAPGSLSGISVAAARDLNNDGIGDLVIGASFAYFNGPRSGSSYVVFGRDTSFPATINLDSLTHDVGFRLDGGSLDLSGSSVGSAGDLNGDGIADLLIGAYGANDFSGRTYVVFGGALVGDAIFSDDFE